MEGKKGSVTKVNGLFDDGAMVNSICKDAFALMKSTLGKLTTSERSLCMADGTIVPSYGRWSGGVTLGGQTAKAAFKIFPSGGGWSLLFGKPSCEHLKRFTTTGMTPSGSLTTTVGQYLQTVCRTSCYR